MKVSKASILQSLCCLAWLMLSVPGAAAAGGGVSLDVGAVQIVLPAGWEKLNQPTNFFVQQRARNVERAIAVGAGSHKSELPLDKYIVIALAGCESRPEPQFENLSKILGVPVAEVEKLLQSEIGIQLLQKIKDSSRSMRLDVLSAKKIDIAGCQGYEVRIKGTVRDSGVSVFTRQFILPGTQPGEIIEITFAGLEEILQDESLPGAIQKKIASPTGDPAPGEKAFIYYNSGIEKAQNGDFAGATSDFTKAIELKSDYAEAYCKRGMAMGALAKSPSSDMTSIIADYNKAIQLKPDYTEAYYNRALTKQVKADNAGALADYDKVIEFDPTNVKAYNNRGTVRAVSRNLDGALSDLNKAIELEPNNYLSYERRAAVKRAKGDLSGAKADSETARTLKAQTPRYP